jgi:hypothetical protein
MKSIEMDCENQTPFQLLRSTHFNGFRPSARNSFAGGTDAKPKPG